MELFEQISRIITSGDNAVLVTITGTSGGTPGKVGFKLLVTEDGKTHGTVGGGAVENSAIEEAKNCLKTGTSKSISIDLSEIDMECGGKIDLFFEYITGQNNFVLFGGGHVGSALSRILNMLGYSVHIFDNRPEAVEKLSGIPDIHPLLGDYTDISPINDILTASNFCFIATHGHEHDQTVLEQILTAGGTFTYMGMIGSARKVKNTLSRIAEKGIAIPDSLYTPVGLDIGGDSAAEIAVSIAAEVLAVTKGKKAPYMRRHLEKI